MWRGWRIAADGTGFRASTSPDRRPLDRPLAFELDAVVLRERSPHDALQVLQSPSGSRALPLGQACRLPPAHRLAPEDVHGTLPAGIEELRGEIERVCHTASRPILSPFVAGTGNEIRPAACRAFPARARQRIDCLLAL